LAYFEFEPHMQSEELHPSYDPSMASSLELQGRVRTHVCIAEYTKVTSKDTAGNDVENMVPLYTQAQRKWDVYKHKYISEPVDDVYGNP